MSEPSAPCSPSTLCPIDALFAQIGQGRANNLFSPIGVRALLRALQLGAAGPAALALDAILGPAQDKITPATVRAAFEEAFSLWTRSFTLNSAYLEKLAARCPLSVAQLPEHGAADAVNAWVKAATRGKIEQLPGDISADVRLLLVSAVYFKARWLHEFSDYATHEGVFHALDAAPCTVQLMDQCDHFSYAGREAYEWIRLPYQQTSIVMDVLLPRQVQEPLAYLAELLTEGARSPAARYGRLRLPRFSAQWSDSVAAPLQAAGLAPLFSPALADFSPMGEAAQGLCVSDIRQSVFVAVDEVGTEAAAVTYAPIGGCSMPPAPVFDFCVDRPFLFAIRDRADGAVLFLGAIRRPA